MHNELFYYFMHDLSYKFVGEPDGEGASLQNYAMWVQFLPSIQLHYIFRIFVSQLIKTET